MSWVAAAVAGGMLVKNFAVDQPAANRQRKLASVVNANSWLTGQHAGPVKDPNYAGDAISGAATGAALHQSSVAADAANKQSEATSRWLDADTAAKSTAGLNAPAEMQGGAPSDFGGAPAADPGIQPTAQVAAQQQQQAGMPGSPWLRSARNPAMKYGQFPV